MSHAGATSLPITIAAVAILAGCATTRVGTEWRDPAFAIQPLTGKRVLVACRAQEETLRRVCEDEWAQQLSASGVNTVRSYTLAGFSTSVGDLSEEMRAAARGSGAAAVASTSLQAGRGVVSGGGGSQVGVGVGAGGGSGGGFSFGGVSIGVPIGGGSSSSGGLGASTSVVDVASGKLVWSAIASSPASVDTRAQMPELTRVAIEAMRKAGLL